MRESLLIGSMLNNSESCINITKQDLTKLEMPDKALARLVLDTHGNPSTAFMYLELGLLPVRFLIMKKRLNFLRCILNESMDSMIRKRFEVLKTDNRKGDFVDLVNQDLRDNNIELTENEIKDTSKLYWKKYVREGFKKKPIESVIMIIPRRNKVKEARSIWSLILKIV